jgi:hypothetical protein
MFTIVYEIREYIHEQRQHNQRVLNMLTDINTRLDALQEYSNSLEDSVDTLSGDLLDVKDSISDYKTINLVGTFTKCS